MKRPTNPAIIELIRLLRKQKAGLWKKVLKHLEKSKRKGVEVNLNAISRVGSDSVVVPGVVLSSGELKKPVEVAAVRFSMQSINKITKAGGKCLTIREMIEKNPKGKDIKIMV